MSSRGSGIERRRVQASLRRTFDLFEAAIQVPGLQSDSLWKPVGLQMCVGWPPRNSSFFEGVIDLIACLVSSGGQSNDAATRAVPARWAPGARERWPKKTEVPSGRPVGLSVNQTVLRLAQEFFLAFPCATPIGPIMHPLKPILQSSRIVAANQSPVVGSGLECDHPAEDLSNGRDTRCIREGTGSHGSSSRSGLPSTASSLRPAG